MISANDFFPPKSRSADQKPYDGPHGNTQRQIAHVLLYGDRASPIRALVAVVFFFFF